MPPAPPALLCRACGLILRPLDRCGLGCLDLLDLALADAQPFMLSRQSLLGMRRQRLAGSGDQGLEMCDEIATARIDPSNAQQHQQPRDPVTVRGSFGHQHRAFSMLALRILFGGARDAHHPAGPRLATLQRQQHPDQLLQIETIGLDPPCPPVDRHARRIDHAVLDASHPQRTVQPETVIARWTPPNTTRSPLEWRALSGAAAVMPLTARCCQRGKRLRSKGGAFLGAWSGQAGTAARASQVNRFML